MTIQHIPVGSRVRVTEENLQRIRAQCTSQYGHYPCSTYHERVAPLVRLGLVGVVTHDFKPGYELTVRFHYNDSDAYFRLFADEVEVVSGPDTPDVHTVSIHTEGRHDGKA